jgi:hypothetical protein
VTRQGRENLRPLWTRPPPPSQQVREIRKPRREFLTAVDRNVDPVEAPLADALTRAAAAGEWSVVGQLARELEARRKAYDSDKVVRLPARGRRER